MSEAATGTDLVTLDDEQVEAALRGDLDATKVQIAIEDPQKVALDIIKRILDSPDKDAVLGGNQAVGGKEVLGRPFTLRGVRWLKSSFDSTVPVFAILDAVMLDDGEAVAITTGSTNVMAQAFKLHQLDALPCDVKIVEASKETAAGFRPQWLEQA